jgi:mono/diheme cytochrome c family protein
MDWQPKYEKQAESAFFADHRVARLPPEGTIARGSLKEDTAFFQGKLNGGFVAKAPIQVDETVLRRGQQRFNIYCTPCHDQTGGGNGAVFQHGYPKPLSVYADHARGLADGELFDIVTNGVRNMPAYGPQIPEKDRWAIVAWMRVLQKAGHGAVVDIPADVNQSNMTEEQAQ